MSQYGVKLRKLLLGVCNVKVVYQAHPRYVTERLFSLEISFSPFLLKRVIDPVYAESK